MYKSKLASMIDKAVNDCIAFGRGRTRDIPGMIDIEANWAENETDIEITIFESCAIRFTYTETINI